MSKLFFNDQYTACEHAFDTTRKSACIAESFRTDPCDGIVLTDPKQSLDKTARLVGSLHTKAYVRAVRTGLDRRLAESQGFIWDRGM